MSTCTHTSRHISWGQLCSIFSMCELTTLQQRVCVWREHVPSCRYLCVMIMCFEGAPCFLNWCQQSIDSANRQKERKQTTACDGVMWWFSEAVGSANLPDSTGMYSHTFVRSPSAFSKYAQDDVHICAIRPCLFSCFLCVTLSHCFDMLGLVCAPVQPMSKLWCLFINISNVCVCPWAYMYVHAGFHWGVNQQIIYFSHRRLYDLSPFFLLLVTSPHPRRLSPCLQFKPGIAAEATFLSSSQARLAYWLASLVALMFLQAHMQGYILMNT